MSNAEYMRERRKTKEGLLAQIIGNQRNKSKKRGHPAPSYSLHELREWAFACDKFHSLHEDWVKSGYNIDKTPSIDRLDDYKPYTIDNIRFVTWLENNIRGREDQRNGLNTKKAKTVVQIKNGEVVEKFYSARQASRDTGIDQGQLSACARGLYNSAGGYQWEYV